MHTNRRAAPLRSGLTLALLAVIHAAAAQDVPAPAAPAAQAEAAPADDAKTLDKVVVVGSHIQGAATTDALPVLVVGAEQIDAAGAISGDELMRTIPQMGDVLFDASNNPQTSNAARGDVNSVNLRSLGVGNTLVLLNGRRLVQHPTSQGTSDTGTVPVQSFNSNAIPVSGLDRMEILLDGAAAIYGADAVAGVVNTVLQTDFDGVSASARYGTAEGTGMNEFETNVFAGKNFDRGNVSVFLNYTDRSELMAADQEFTSTDDLRALFADYPDFAGLTALDGRSSHTPWARLTVGPRAVIRSNGVAVTNTAGAFRVQPSSFGCGVNFGTDLCLASGNHNFNTTNRDMRYDTRYGTTVRPSVERFNAYLTGHYSLDNGVEAFGEVGYYQAVSEALQPPVVNLNSLWIPASNYWNPFGATTLPDGTPNPNRLPGLTNVPAAGLPVQMSNYRYVDTGFQRVRVENYQARFLAGLRGEWNGWNWETALLYSEAEAEDRSPNINMTALQQQLALATPDAYNPFSGGCVATPTHSDCSPSSQAAIDAIVFDLVRKSRTTLTMADFKMSRADLFALPAGEVGIAFGAEARRETQEDDRDANLDGTYTFTDMVTGETNLSNVAAVSPNPDTRGSRNVGSAYVEFAVPLVSADMDIPLVHRLDMQLAGRYEHYSDFGSVAKPKVALAWDVVEGVRLRGSYSEGFRAPNLEQTNATQYSRLASGVDHIRCEADLRAGRIASFSACGQNTAGASLLVAGNPDLEPEESTNTSYGVVFQPTFIPERFGNFTFTVDRWKIKQEQIVGLLGAQTALTLDYLNRVEGGSNPLVVRADPTQDDIDFFAGTGIDPVGQVIAINDRFINLQPQTAGGLDIGMDWSLRRTRFGSFSASLNATKLLEFTRDPGDIVNALYAARAAGTIDPLTPLPDPSQLIGQNGRPEWRASGSLTWNKGPWRVGYSAQYMSSFEQPQLLGASGDPWVVEDRLFHNLYGQYRFPDGTALRLGVRDLTDEGPALADGGYRGSLHNPWGRYFYVNISRSF
ncbi:MULTISPECIES: TonB-dependent receptor [unclassified Pseudoxanthomonas]|uniref:TonB-dependent receptor domain-containing protein n=1 Tax=unclassified Pseudoxanthomonas TaxID=2645906 RepID=UPI0008E5541F|nr:MULTISPECIES: TonB-dependent receptor [unclassified Pseudoxanthomonas]PPJ41176.1 TonB-dependent receptor [Pseudoxanthomonas sp. KAs_5_3]SFV31036.1 TonB-dependent Receptor Plug Domain [Pseudoxanthomonas sp. YR558]